MQFGLVLAGLVGVVAAIPSPQGVTASIAPSSTPETCSPTYNGGAKFQIGIVNATTASKAKRAIPDGLDPNDVPGNSLILTLEGGLLKDYFGRTGYVASNGQLQFDQPVQDGALYTAGFSACPNSTLALQSAVWYECLSGMYYNLYDDSIAPYCSPSYLEIIPYSATGDSDAAEVTATATAPVSTMAYSSVTAVSQITDGQPQAATTAYPVSQITDGQVQAATTAIAPVSQITDGQVQAAATSVAAVSQITDGQIQAPANATSSLMPYSGNSAPSISISGSMLALIAGAIGLGALL